MGTLQDYFKSILKNRGFPCLVEINRKFEETVVSGANLWTMALVRQHKLRSLKLAKGDVFIDQSTGIDRFVNLIACLIGSYHYLPIDHLTLSNTWNTGPKVKSCVWVGENQFSVSDLSYPPHLIAIKEFLVVIRTSGTQSKSGRWIGLNADHILHQLKAHQQVIPISLQSNRLCLLPSFHAFGLILDRLFGLFVGQNIFLPMNPMWSMHNIGSILKRYEISFLALVPRQIQWLISLADKDPQLLSYLRNLEVHTGGAYVSNELEDLARSTFKRFYLGYGLTEAGPGVLINGQPVGCEVKLMPIDSNSRLSRIFVKTESLGYMENQDKIDGDSFLITGDYAVKQSQNILILGREGETLKGSHGEWLVLPEIENRLSEKFQGLTFSLSQKPMDDKLLLICRVIVSEFSNLVKRQIEARLRLMLGKEIDLKVQLFRGELIDVLLNSKYKSLRDGLILSRDEDLKNFLICDTDQEDKDTGSDQVSESA